jgi:hypothetical protein
VVGEAVSGDGSGGCRGCDGGICNGILVTVAITATVVVVARVVARALGTCSVHCGKGGGVDDHGLSCVDGC